MAGLPLAHHVDEVGALTIPWSGDDRSEEAVALELIHGVAQRSAAVVQLDIEGQRDADATRAQERGALVQESTRQLDASLPAVGEEFTRQDGAAGLGTQGALPATR